MMSGIRGKNTKPELIVRSYLHRSGLRFRLHGRLPGKPDIVLKKYRTVVFVHGCFWHQHEGCRYAATPATNVGFWQAKFRDNVQRDRKVKEQLTAHGWRVLIAWECELDEQHLQALANTIRNGESDS